MIPDKLEIRKTKELIKTDRHDDFFTVKISDKDEIVFFTFKGSTPQYVYKKHQHCDGEIFFIDMNQYLIMKCGRCSLRMGLPSNITTISRLREYFKNIKLEEKEDKQSRFELMDIEE